MSTVLVSLPSGVGVVREDDGSVVVTNNVSAGRSGTYLREDDRFHPVKHWVDEDHCVVGGFLPPGAASAYVLDDRGVRVAATVDGGAFVAVMDQPNDGNEPIVCCRDGAGDPVRRPWPAGYPSVRVTDAEVPCPACGAVDYDEYTPFEERRGGRGGPNGTVIPNPVVSCRVCGHEEAEPHFMRSGPSSGTDEDVARIAQARARMRKQRWRSTQMTLRETRFPIYAVDGWPSELGGSGSHGGRSSEITIRHYDTPDFDPFAIDLPRLQVTTKHGESFGSDLRAARSALDEWLRADNGRAPWPEVSPAALTLWLRARDRSRRAVLLGAERPEQFIWIDDALTPALTLVTRRRWVAAARRSDLTIVIAGHDVDPGSIHVRPITDPLGQLLGPEPPDA